MKVEHINDIKTVYTFNSISELLKFIEANEPTKRFNDMMLSLNETESFTGTNSFEESMELLRSGWESGAKKLNTELKTLKTANGFKTKQFYSVAGYQCSVPRYLQGIPTNMVNSKRVVTKNKVVDVVKNIGYNCNWKADDIMEQGIKFIELVNKLETEGTRCNIYAMLSDYGRDGSKTITKVKIKDSSQRMNLKQIAFPLAHPGFFRRIMFAFIERCKEMENVGSGYGKSKDSDVILNDFRKEFKKCYLIPSNVIEEHITEPKKYWCD